MDKITLALKASVEKRNEKMTIIASDETLDRSGEVVRAKDWDLTNFIKSPRLLIDHDYSVKSIVGLAEGIRVENNRLLFEPNFHDITEAAQQTKEMVEQGYLDTVSVGFLRKGDGENIVNELLEISFVAVPANANARVLSVKDVDADAEKAIEAFVKSDDETVEEETTEETTATEPEEVEEVEEVVEESSEAIEEAQKGVIDDTLSSNRDRNQQKYDNFDPIYFKFWDFFDAYFSQSVEPEAIGEFWKDFVSGVDEMLKNSGSSESKEIKASAIEYMKTKGFEQKAGKVLSGKNKEKVSGAIESMKQASGALQDVLDASEGTDEKSSLKQRSSGVESDKEAMELFLLSKQALRAVNTATSEALSKLKSIKK